jgi:toxin ParE1/3/4
LKPPVLRRPARRGNMPFRTTRQADQDIIDIFLRGCREFEQDQAERYHQGLAASFARIADHPRMARERNEFEPSVRLHPYPVAHDRLFG